MPTTPARLLGILGMILTSAWSSAHAAQTLVYFGTYTGAKSEGIYLSRLDPQNGTLSRPELAAAVQNPSFLALHPTGEFLYAVGELSEVNGRPGGAISAFKIDPATGTLTLLNQESSRGAGPCHLTVDKSGRWVLLANYGGGSVAVLPIRKDGHLGPMASFIQHEGSSVNPGRQSEPHAHSINLDAANRFALAADLGLDQVVVYRFDPSTGSLTRNDPPGKLSPGSGPRHLAFHPQGSHAFVINEMLSTLSVFQYQPRSGKLTEVMNVPTLPKGFAGNSSTAEVQVHPSGRFVYGSNRGHDSIAVFEFDDRTGALTLVEIESTQGRTPRNFGIDPTGRWLLAANQESDSVVVFEIDPKTGALTPTASKIEVGAPVCVKFLARK